MRTSISLLLFSLLGSVVASSGCASLSPLPRTPRLEALTEEQVFATAPPAEWPTVSPENPAQASVDVACGVAPQIGNGTIYAAVSVRGRQMPGTMPPLNVSLVLDRSGSMSGKPFDNMLRAAEAFVQASRDGDRLSVVVFSDGVFEAIAPIVIDPASRADAIMRVRALRDGGGTWLSGGYLGGLAEVFQFFSEWQINQIVLLSDGQPNRGITDSGQLMAIAARAAEHGVSTTTIGFGHLHDELLMQGMADAGGGTYHYVGKPEDIPAIFQREANSILRTAVRGTWAILAIPPGLVVEDVIGWDYMVLGPQLWVFVGAVPFEEERYAVVKLKPSGVRQGPLSIAVSYADVMRRGKFGVDCRPMVSPTGGNEAWVLELAGRAESAWGLAEAMGWADTGSEIFAMSQIQFTRDLVKMMQQRLGPTALTQEDGMLAAAQQRLGIGVAQQAAGSFLGGGVQGLMNFGARQVERNVTAAVVAKTDANFRPLVRQGMPFQVYGRAGTRYSARSQRAFKLHEADKSNTYKQARFDAYVMMRVRTR